MKQSEFKAFSELLSGVADYYGKPLAPAAIEIWWNALRRLDLAVLRHLLSDHVKASRFMPAVSDVLDRVRAMDGRPGAEEAWAMMPLTEAASVVWTDEMAEAFAVANPLIQDGDKIAARMAFTERYRVLVREARELGRQVRWTPSLGHDAAEREGVLLEAVRRRRITVDHAQRLLPRDDGAPQRLLELLERNPVIKRTPEITDAAA